MAGRIRRSLIDVQNDYDSGKDPTQLETLITAWAGIKALPPSNPNSFFVIGGFHGQPFRGKGASDENYWGGYCEHGNVLFPSWHRGYLWYLENSLRTIPGCANVTQPFWDETSPDSSKAGLPWVLSGQTFTYKTSGQTVDNPLRSFLFPADVVDPFANDAPNYTKLAGYETVRYPLSGLVAPDDASATAQHNAQYPDPVQNAQILNGNVTLWLNAPSFIATNADGQQFPVTANLLAKFQQSLNAPNYTVFSNTTSAQAWNRRNRTTQTTPVVPLEDPHNGMHLAIGGFDYPGAGSVNQIPGANGDMGENNTAGLDPVFFFHHAFIDYVFWTWQKIHNSTASLVIQAGYPGTLAGQGQRPVSPPQEDGTPLSADSPLTPFKNPDGSDQTTNNVADIVALGYNYGPGSLDPQQPHIQAALAAHASPAPTQSHVIHVPDVDRTKFAGSFVINSYAIVDGKKHLVGTTPVLSRYGIQGCANCQSHLSVDAFHTIPGHNFNVVPASSLIGSTGPVPRGTLPILVEIQEHKIPSKIAATQRALRADQAQGSSSGPKVTSAVVASQPSFEVTHVVQHK